MKFPFVVSDKVIYAVDGISQFVLHFVIELQGRCSAPHLAQAIDLALCKSPILKSVARLRPFASYWEVVEDLTSSSIFSVEDISHEAAAETVARDLVDRYVNEYMDITQCPPARFLLIRLPEERWIFIVKVHHCALDPVAIAHLVEDIQDYYGKLLRQEPIPPPAPMEDRGRWPLFKNISPLLWGRMLWRWTFKFVRYRREEKRGQRRHVQFSAPDPRSDTMTHRSVKFRGENYARLRRRAKSLGVTSNVLFTTALCQAIHQWNGSQGRASEPVASRQSPVASEKAVARDQRPATNEFYTIVMPVDMRWYARKRGKVPRIMSNYVGGTLITVPVEVLTSFERTAHHLAQEANFIKEHHIGLRHNLLLPLLYFLPPRWLRGTFKKFYARRPSRFAPTAVVAYMGKGERLLTTFPDCEITGLEGIGTGFYPVGFDVIVMSYGKEYNVTFSYPKGACREPEMDDFVSLFSHELLADQGRPMPDEKRRTSRVAPEATSDV